MPSLTVLGMSCDHCRASVTKALETFPGVSGVQVDLATGKVAWQEAAPVSLDSIQKSILDLGFEVAQANAPS